jgi:hypothetical protein
MLKLITLLQPIAQFLMEKKSLGRTNKGKILGLENRMTSSQIINNDICFPFCLIFILRSSLFPLGTSPIPPHGWQDSTAAPFLEYTIFLIYYYVNFCVFSCSIFCLIIIIKLVLCFTGPLRAEFFFKHRL